ncbi:MAG: zinc ribbon domain-containing protein [Lachnospiraceae bacterium]|nr:zinc ribbon domain-containing protein [Lachnospiraceae bacterium]
MYCIKCGFKNKDEAIFCANCGTVMTKKPSDAFDQEIQSGEKSNGIEKNFAEENRTSGIEDIQPAKQATEEDFSRVSLEKPEAVQSGEMNQVDTVSNSADIYRSPYTQENRGNNQVYRIRKFSIPRFIFSLIIILATFCSIATIAFKYVGVTLTMEEEILEYSKSETEYYNVKGYKIIKEKDYLGGEKLIYKLEKMREDTDEFVDTLNMFRYIIIAFMVAILVFCIIDFMLLCLLRNRIAYLLTIIFVFVKAALGGIAIYIWSVDILNQFKKVFELSMNESIDFGRYRILIECAPGIGLILALVMQAVILISAVVLLCIRPKYQEVAPQTISA